MNFIDALNAHTAFNAKTADRTIPFLQRAYSRLRRGDIDDYSAPENWAYRREAEGRRASRADRSLPLA